MKWRFFFGCSLYVRLGISFLTSRVELGLTGLTSTSRNVRRTFHVPSGVPVQRSISRRDVSHPVTSRSGLLTFFSSLVIQECLINFAGERQRSRMTSHCEIILGFYLSASHPELNSGVKLSSPSQKWRAFPQTSAERFTFLPAFESNVPFLGAMSHILEWSFTFVFVS